MNDDIVPCPHCGADINADASFCRHCGSSDTDGWKEAWEDDTDDDFDYDEFVKDEFSPRVTNTNTLGLWRITALILLAAFAFVFYNFAMRIY